jgi:hypothetical protein
MTILPQPFRDLSNKAFYKEIPTENETSSLCWSRYTNHLACDMALGLPVAQKPSSRSYITSKSHNSLQTVTEVIPSLKQEYHFYLLHSFYRTVELDCRHNQLLNCNSVLHQLPKHFRLKFHAPKPSRIMTTAKTWFLPQRNHL